MTDKEAASWARVALFFLTIPAYFWIGWVTACLWSWFVVPLGLPEISLGHAIGLYSLVSLWTHQLTHSEDTVDHSVRLALRAYIAPLVALVVGALAR